MEHGGGTLLEPISESTRLVFLSFFQSCGQRQEVRAALYIISRTHFMPLVMMSVGREDFFFFSFFLVYLSKTRLISVLFFFCCSSFSFGHFSLLCWEPGANTTKPHQRLVVTHDKDAGSLQPYELSSDSTPSIPPTEPATSGPQ